MEKGLEERMTAFCELCKSYPAVLAGAAHIGERERRNVLFADPYSCVYASFCSRWFRGKELSCTTSTIQTMRSRQASRARSALRLPDLR